MSDCSHEPPFRAGSLVLLYWCGEYSDSSSKRGIVTAADDISVRIFWDDFFPQVFDAKIIARRVRGLEEKDDAINRWIVEVY